jgi:phosphatidylserine/phosphatidylglycerophosphate/cardiolipin synthase-like enzyme
LRKSSRFALNKGFGFLILLLYAAALYVFSQDEKSVLPQKEFPVCLYSNQAGDNLRHTVTDAIYSAKESITCVIYSLTDEEVIHALKSQAEKGVQITVVYDAIASHGIEEKAEGKFQCIPVRKKGLMHNKLLAIDETVAYLGSSNFTRDSLSLHANLVLGIHSKEVVQAIREKAAHLAAEVKGSSKISPLTNDTFELYFLQDYPKTLERVQQLLSSAKKSVKVAMFTFTHPALTQKLIDLHHQGIKVQVVIDNDSSRKTSRIAFERFKKEKMDVRVSKRSGLLHEKIAIVDDEILLGGSTNWTKAAFNANEEHLFILSKLSDAHKEKLAHFWQTTLHESAPAY